MAIPVLPPSAPFTPEQRAYLNGFFAGVCGLDGATTSINRPVAVAYDDASLNRVGSDSGDNHLIAAPAASPAAINGVAPSQDEVEAYDEMPWHDPALGIDERMELAQGKPIKLQLMAAMAQLDCGQCGYVCKSYAEAIVDGSEKSLKKCIPGAKETATKLKEIMVSA